MLFTNLITYGTGPLRTYDPCDPLSHGSTDDYVRVFGRGLTAIQQATPFDASIESFADVFILGMSNPNLCETGAGGGGTTIPGCTATICVAAWPAWPSWDPAKTGWAAHTPTLQEIDDANLPALSMGCFYKRTSTISRTRNVTCTYTPKPLCPTTTTPETQTRSAEEIRHVVQERGLPCMAPHPGSRLNDPIPLEHNDPFTPTRADKDPVNTPTKITCP